MFLSGSLFVAGGARANGIYLGKSHLTAPRPQRDVERLLARCAAAHVRDVYLQVGSLQPPELAEQARRIMTLFRAEPTLRLSPFLGRRVCATAGQARCFDLRSAADRARLKQQARTLWELGFDGVQVDLEPVPSGDPHFLALLAELQQDKPRGKLLSVAGSMLEPDAPLQSEVPLGPRDASAPLLWDRAYCKQVMARADVVMVMNYDTGIRTAQEYERWTRYQLRELLVLQRETGKPVQLGIPAYRIGRRGLHDPSVENPGTAFAGIRKELERSPDGLGVALYVEDEMSAADWKSFIDFAASLSARAKAGSAVFRAMQ